MLALSIRRAMLGLAAGAVGVVGYGHLIEPFWLEVTRFEVALPLLPGPLDGLVIAQLSDFHLRPGAGPNDALDRAMRACNQAQPDLVVLTGDYLGERHGLSELPGALAQLRVRPAYAVLGNHDYRFGPKHRRAIEGYFSDAGIELLDNRSAAFERAGARLWIVGVGDGLTSHDRLEEATRGLGERDRPRVLLTHYPDLLLDLPTEEIDLSLAGHSHGAQVHLPFLARFALRRSWTVFDRGLVDVAGVPMYVNRGLGTSGRRIRLFARPELTLLTLRTAPPARSTG